MNLFNLNNHSGIISLRKSFFIKSIFSAGITSGLKLFNGILIIKAIAIISGLSGMPEGGNYINITQIAQIFATAGISMGIIKYLSQHQKDSEAFRDYVTGAFFLTIIFSGISALLLILFSPVLSDYFFQTKAYFYYFVFLGISSVFFGLNNFLLSYFNGTQNLKDYVGINTVNAIVGLVLILFTIYLKNRHLLFISIAFYQTGGFLFYGFLKMFHIYKKEIAGNPIRIWEPAKKFAGYAYYTLQNIIVIGVSQIYVRNLIIEKHGISEAGLWDGMIRISSSYLNVFILILSIFFIPKLSSVKVFEAVNTTLRKGGLITGLLICSLVVLYLLKDFILTLVLSNQFLPIKEIMAPFLIGDIFRFAGYILAIFFLSRGIIQITIFADLIFNGLLFCLLNKYLITSKGIEGSSFAYLLNYGLYFFFLVIMLLIMKKKISENG
jgi:O-antigen/teichoic acid export membrane protein